MKITHKISMDLDRYSVPGFDAVCGDRNTRELEIALYAGSQAWEIPAEASVTVRYQKPDGTGGFYDLLPDSTAAWGISGNVVTITLAPQTLTVPGCVIMTATVTPENSTDAVVWTSSDESVATVADGLVTSVGKGDCVITATAGTVSATCSVSVRTVNDLIHTHSYTAAVTRAATCTEPGIKTYTCLCGESYTEEIPAAGHSYVDGVCTVCGATDPDASDETALLYRWDFTKSLTDTVSGLAATAEVTTKADGCGEVPVQDSTGVHFSGIGQALGFGNIFTLNRTYEIDIAHMECLGAENMNVRFFTLWQGSGSNTVSGFLYRHTYNYWSVYSGGWANNPYGLTDRNAFSGKTVTLKIASDGACELLVDGVSKGICDQRFTGNWNVLQLGSTAIDGNDTAANMGGNLFNCTITGFRIYEGVE